ncbi:MAG: GNAT family N-acetyltransferase [Dermatophilaceae bacterium]|nr:GNAT family N-acetyltransferase [Dermatophilaceae bacterium]
MRCPARSRCCPGVSLIHLRSRQRATRACCTDGYVDMMFVSPRHQRRGVARQLLAHVEAHARSEGTPALSAEASLTARPFFERAGFTVEAEQHPVKAGVELTNYKMRKELS